MAGFINVYFKKINPTFKDEYKTHEQWVKKDITYVINVIVLGHFIWNVSLIDNSQLFIGVQEHLCLENLLFLAIQIFFIFNSFRCYRQKNPSSNAHSPWKVFKRTGVTLVLFTEKARITHHGYVYCGILQKHDVYWPNVTLLVTLLNFYINQTKVNPWYCKDKHPGNQCIPLDSWPMCASSILAGGTTSKKKHAA